MRITETPKTILRTTCGILFLLASFAGGVWAQSTDVAWPSPVRTNEVVSKIAARDLGDPRVTDHYYAFTGTPGDLLITVESLNLNGDVDVFTLSGLRPLLKFTIYAGSPAPITKSIYLRQQEDLLLRVEGRTPNDDNATYQIRFNGSFAPITSGPLAEHEDQMQTATAGEVSGRGGRRVSSAGARIDEPRTEVVVATPTPAPTVESTEPKPGSTRSARNSRTRRPAPRRTRPREPAKPEDSAATGETENKPPAEISETETKPRPKGRRTTRRTSAARPADTPPVIQQSEESGPRLLIETNDGTLVDRFMNSVRRVTVENGQVVVVSKDGKIQRIPLASVVRMTISP